MFVFVLFGMHYFMYILISIIMPRKRELVSLHLLAFGCLVTVVPWVGLQCVIVVFPDHTYLPFAINKWQSELK